MSLILLFLSPALFGLYLIIRIQICANRRRRLVDTYGLDPKKLRKMTCREVSKLRTRIDQMNDEGDARGLELTIGPYRP